VIQRDATRVYPKSCGRLGRSMKRRDFLKTGGAAGLGLAAWGLFSKDIAAAPAADAVKLARRISGRVLLPGDDAYEQRRRVATAWADRRPALIVQCVSARDVQHSIAFARERGLAVAVRCGGHSIPGHGTCDGGLVGDLSTLKGADVDPSRKIVRVAGGSLAGEIDRATASFGLATVMGECPTVGVSGFVLGGGEGHLMSKFGVGSDNIAAVEMVLADGRLVKARASENSDLYWAARGGGGNFGVVTAIECALHEVGNVVAGNIAFEATDVAAFLRFARDYGAAAPDELTMIPRIVPGPGGKKIVAVRATYCGDPASAEAVFKPLRQFAKPLKDSIKLRPYLAFQSEGPAEATPVFDHIRSGFLPQMSDAVIAIVARHIERAPESFTLSLPHLHGAVSRIAPDATAYPLRTPGFDCWIEAEWETPAARERAVTWVDAFWAEIAPHTKLAYVNGLSEEGNARVRSAYGANYDRLARIKRQFDPDNIFRFNQNILPA